MARKPIRPPAGPCTGHNRRGEPCGNHARVGATVCPSHGGNAPHVKAKAAVRAEVLRWGLGDTTVDPGETLLRLVSQSAARAEHYARLLADAYDAAERLKTAHETGKLLKAGARDGDGDSAGVQQAKADLDRIFNTGGVAALVGTTYSSSNTGSLYATGEAIRGLAKLEAEERDRCAGFAVKAIAAGLAEREVRIAEREAAAFFDVIEAALAGAGVTGPAILAGRRAAAERLRLVQEST